MSHLQKYRWVTQMKSKPVKVFFRFFLRIMYLRLYLHERAQYGGDGLHSQ